MHDIYAYICGLLVLVAGAIALYFRGYVSGKKDEHSSQAASDLKAQETQNEVVFKAMHSSDEVGGMSDSAVVERLRDKYTRD